MSNTVGGYVRMELWDNIAAIDVPSFDDDDDDNDYDHDNDNDGDSDEPESD